MGDPHSRMRLGWLLGAPVADLEWARALVLVLGACLRGLLAGLLLPLLLLSGRVLAASMLTADRACADGAWAAGAWYAGGPMRVFSRVAPIHGRMWQLAMVAFNPSGA